MNKHIVEPETKMEGLLDLFESHIDLQTKLITEARMRVDMLSKLFKHSESRGE